MSTASLLKEIEKLPYQKLSRLVPQVLAIQARKSPRLKSARETTLLRRITQGPPARLTDEYRSLVQRRREEDISSEQQARLVEVANELEAFNVRWLRWVSDLAKMQGSTVAGVMKGLDLPARPYV